MQRPAVLLLQKAQRWWRLTIVGGVRERPGVTRRGRGKTVCARGAWLALLGGPSTSPLDRTVRVRAATIAVLLVACAPAFGADTTSTMTKGDSAPCSASKLSESSAISLAVGDLNGHGIDVGDFYPPTATCDASAKGKTWSVYFQSKRAVQNGCFWVLVDDQTGKVDPLYVAC